MSEIKGKKIKLISWNMKTFRENEENLKKNEVINSFLKSDTNTIVVLQEVKSNLEENLKVDENEKKTIKYFENFSNTRAFFKTVIITKLKDLNVTVKKVDNKDKVNYVNRYVKIEVKEKVKEKEKEGKTILSILGLHAKDAKVLGEWLESETEKIVEVEEIVENNDENNDAGNKKRLRVIKEEKEYYKPDIMIGDFNSGNYLKKDEDRDVKINRAAYQKVSTGYIDVCQGMYTRGTAEAEATQIDHILIKNSKEVWDKIEVKNPSCGYKEVLCEEKEKDFNGLSDHLPISCEIIFK